MHSRLAALARTRACEAAFTSKVATRLDWEGTRRGLTSHYTAIMAALRISLSPSAFALHSRQFQRFLALPVGIRHASSAPPPKPRLLEKPDRFNPPSHPSRLRSKHRSYGAPLPEHERRAQKTRSYPHMMPAEGTFTHWFLTNKSIHLWISIVCESLCIELAPQTNNSLGHLGYAYWRNLDRRLLTLNSIHGSSPTKQHVLCPPAHLHGTLYRGLPDAL